MENTETTQPAGEQPMVEIHNLNQPSGDIHAVNHIYPSLSGDESCPTCSAAKNTGPVQYVYAFGTIDGRPRSLGLGREIARVASRTETKGLTDSDVFKEVISKNPYLARKLCWILSIEGLETYILQLMNPLDMDLLISSLRPPSPPPYVLVVGVLGPIAPPQYYNGLQIPIVAVDQIYLFHVHDLIHDLIKSIPKSDKITAKEFTPVAEELFMRITQMTDGGTNYYRALNWLAFSYPPIYFTTFECYGRDFSFTGVEIKKSGLSVTRDILDLIFTFTNRTSGVIEKYFCRVDVTELFLFLVTTLQRYFDHD